MKQQPQWGQVQTVTAVQKRAGFVPRYQLDGGENWIAHDRLNLVPDGIVLKPPPAALEDPDFFVTKKLPDRVFYRGYPLAERRENLEGDDAPPAAEQRAAASLSALLD